MTLKLTSAAFDHSGEIPAKYTCEAEDISPPLAWTGVPPNAKSRWVKGWSSYLRRSLSADRPAPLLLQALCA